MSFDRRFLAGLLGLALTLCFCLVCFGATALGQSFVHRQAEEDGTEVVPEAELYRNQGLEPDMELDPVPDFIEPDKVLFSDRVLLRHHWTAEDEINSAAYIRSFLERAKQLRPEMQSYLMVAPPRLALESAFSTDPAYNRIIEEARSRVHAMENVLSSRVGDAAIHLPLLDALTEHQDEYIFYRLTDNWTARGAYYGAQQFLSAAGMDPFPIEAFKESAKSNTSGSLKSDIDALFEDIPNDRQYTYLFDGYNPLTVSLDDPSVRSPMVSIIRSGSGAFLGFDQNGYVFDGLADNRRVLMIMGKSDGAVLAPWMVTSFDRVIFLDMANYNVDEINLWELFSEYNVTDLLLIEDADSISSSRTQSIYRHLGTSPMLGEPAVQIVQPQQP